jgi:hypothetical protein
VTRNMRIGPAPNLEDIDNRQIQRAPEEDEGVNYDDELDAKRVLDETDGDRGPLLPSERRRGVPPEEPPVPQPPTDAQPPVVTGDDDEEPSQ